MPEGDYQPDCRRGVGDEFRWLEALEEARPGLLRCGWDSSVGVEMVKVVAEAAYAELELELEAFEVTVVLWASGPLVVNSLAAVGLFQVLWQLELAEIQLSTSLV